MKEQLFTLALDKEYLPKVYNYYIYRSVEWHEGRPIIDGLYVQREWMWAAHLHRVLK